MSMTGKFKHHSGPPAATLVGRGEGGDRAGETYAPGLSASETTRRHRIAPNQMFS